MEVEGSAGHPGAQGDMTSSLMESEGGGEECQSRWEAQSKSRMIEANRAAQIDANRDRGTTAG